MSANTTAPSLDDLEKRVVDLEIIIKGLNPQNVNPSSSSSESMISKTNTVAQSLSSIESKYESIAHFLKLYQEGGSSLISTGSADLTLSDSAKLEVLAACEEGLRKTCDQLHTVSEMQKFINPETLQGLPGLNGKLKAIEVTGLDQKDLTSQVCQQLHDQIASYNSIIQILSQKFVYWDSLLHVWEDKLGISSTPSTK